MFSSCPCRSPLSLSSAVSARPCSSPRSVPDYDTAKPWPRPPKDPFRSMVYAAPEREWDPKEILNLSWVATGRLETLLPGVRQMYSSTNFVLLGLLLAGLAKAPAWDALDQGSAAMDALPAAREVFGTYRAMLVALTADDV